MARIWFSLTLLLAGLTAVPVTAGPSLFGNKPKPDAARVRTLVETLKSDPDEKKRKAAAVELGWADGRVNPEVGPALAVALQKDLSATVRAEAADSLGQLNQVVPQAGAALESAAADDTALAVRLAAKKALWQYHLSGYRSAKTTDGMATQTAEPPIASPAAPTGLRHAVVFQPPPPVPVHVHVAPPPAELLTSAAYLPPIAPPTGPRVVRPSLFGSLLPVTPVPVQPLLGATPPPILNLTNEPPIAKPAAVSLSPVSAPTAPVPTPTFTPEPTPTLAEPPVPDSEPKLPPFKPDLPSLVLPPDAVLPGSVQAPPKVSTTLPGHRR